MEARGGGEYSDIAVVRGVYTLRRDVGGGVRGSGGGRIVVWLQNLNGEGGRVVCGSQSSRPFPGVLFTLLNVESVFIVGELGAVGAQGLVFCGDRGVFGCEVGEETRDERALVRGSG